MLLSSIWLAALLPSCFLLGLVSGEREFKTENQKLPPNILGKLKSDPKESLVNGVWYHILSQYFSFPTFIIAPEHHINNGTSRIDLVIIRVEDWSIVFVYEGKETYEVSKSKGTNDLDQLHRYLSGVIRENKRETLSLEASFGILAGGTRFILASDHSPIPDMLEIIGDPGVYQQGNVTVRDLCVYFKPRSGGRQKIAGVGFSLDLDSYYDDLHLEGWERLRVLDETMVWFADLYRNNWDIHASAQPDVWVYYRLIEFIWIQNLNMMREISQEYLHCRFVYLKNRLASVSTTKPITRCQEVLQPFLASYERALFRRLDASNQEEASWQAINTSFLKFEDVLRAYMSSTEPYDAKVHVNLKDQLEERGKEVAKKIRVNEDHFHEAQNSISEWFDELESLMDAWEQLCGREPRPSKKPPRVSASAIGYKGLHSMLEVP